MYASLNNLMFYGKSYFPRRFHKNGCQFVRYVVWFLKEHVHVVVTFVIYWIILKHHIFVVVTIIKRFSDFWTTYIFFFNPWYIFFPKTWTRTRNNVVKFSRNGSTRGRSLSNHCCGKSAAIHAQSSKWPRRLSTTTNSVCVDLNSKIEACVECARFDCWLLLLLETII